MNALCIPVTKQKSLKYLSPIAKRFIQEKISFGVVLTDGGKYQIWREENLFSMERRKIG